jgi:hypothetical protein
MDRYAHASDFGGVDLVAPDTRGALDYAPDIDTCLDELVAHDQADVPGSEHNRFLSRDHAVQIHEGLNRSGAVDPWQIVVGKGEEFFGRAGRDDDRPRLDLVIRFPPFVGEYPVPVEADHRGIEADIDAAASIECLCHESGDVDTADRGVLARRPEELVGLLNELAAKSAASVEEGDPGSRISRGNGCA